MSNQNNRPKRQGRDPIYDPALKIKVAREYLSSDLGWGRLAAKYNLPGARTVRHFVQWYQANYPQPLSEEEPSMPMVSEQHSGPQPDKKALLKELEDAKLKIAALETMISIASKEFGIDITKKAGAKQSKP